jgi:hypothetical protein
MTDTKPRQYRRSTPVGRLRSNIAKVVRHASLVQDRIASWGETGDGRLDRVVSKLEVIQVLASEADSILEKMEGTGFAPPKKSSALVYEVGQPVMISPKARARYLSAFKRSLRAYPRLLDELDVDSITPEGEVWVRHGRHLPFMTPKSHLVPRRLV